MDDKIMEAFLNAVKLLVNDDDFPIENSQFWNNYIVPCRDPEFDLDIKKSKHKKLGKFFNFLERQKMIKYNEASKKMTTPHVSGILRLNSKIEKWEPTIDSPIEKDDNLNEDTKLEVKDTIKQYVTPPKLMLKYILDPSKVEDISLKDLKKEVKKYF